MIEKRQREVRKMIGRTERDNRGRKGDPVSRNSSVLYHDQGLFLRARDALRRPDHYSNFEPQRERAEGADNTDHTAL